MFERTKSEVPSTEGYRVMHNYVEVWKNGKTPAVLAGIVKEACTPEEILYFQS